MAFRTISICAGVGGLDLGVRIARPDARCVAFVEREASAAASLVASMEAGRLHPAAIWSDVRTFDAGAWRGAVDCVLSGDPCQGNSVAGKRLGELDDRWLLDRAIDVFDESGAHTFFRENVPGNLAGQLAVAVPALERLGCRVAAGIFSAVEAGANHRRERFFILAQRVAVTRDSRPGDPDRTLADRRQSALDAGAARLRRGDGPNGSDRPHSASRAVVDAEGQRRGEGRAEHARQQGRSAADGAGGALAVTDGEGSQGRRRRGDPIGRQEPDGHARLASGVLASARHDRPFAPGPSDPVWGEIIRDAPSLEPAVCRMAHGVAGRIERLRHCGNGVVPLAAALAWVRLHGLLADEAAGGAFRAADDHTARAGQLAMRNAA